MKSMEQEQSIQTITGVAAAEIAPAGGGFLLWNLTLNEWVAAATLLYIALQIGLLIPNYYRAIKKLFIK